MSLNEEKLIEIIKQETKHLARQDTVDNLGDRVGNLEGKVDHLIIDMVNVKEDISGLATRDDIVQFKDDILTAVSNITKTHETIDEERAANQGAHDRIQTDINEVRRHAGLGIKNPVLGT